MARRTPAHGGLACIEHVQLKPITMTGSLEAIRYEHAGGRATLQVRPRCSDPLQMDPKRECSLWDLAARALDTTLLALLPPPPPPASAACDAAPALPSPCPALLQLLEQRKLPLETEWLAIDGPKAAWTAIRDMTVRGAPAIGASRAAVVCP